MKFSLSLFMGLVVAATSANAGPITYTINFTGSGLLPTSGQFTYNDMGAPGSQFTDFFVEWGFLIFDLTASANAPTTFGACTPPSPPATFSFLDGATPCTGGAPSEWFADHTDSTPYFDFFSNDFGGIIRLHAEPTINLTVTEQGRAGGSFTIATSIPEPSTMSLALTGLVGAAFLSWKRRRRSLATTTPETAKN